MLANRLLEMNLSLEMRDSHLYNILRLRLLEAMTDGLIQTMHDRRLVRVSLV